MINLFSFPCLAQTTADSHLPPLLLANKYTKQIDIKKYLVSEKLDGVRAYWNGQQLISRQGNPFHAPNWFTLGFPEQALDGELWIGRQQFEKLVSTVQKYQADEQAWRQVKYMVFDLPHSTKPFSERLLELEKIISQHNLPQLQLIKQFTLEDKPALMRKLDAMIRAGGEGLMLHRSDSLYKKGRHADLLKVKRYEDDEAVVIAHLPGKGKYEGMLGALLVKNSDGLTFRIGSGFKDKERANPPPVGSTVTYKFYGKTRKGIPKFASFLRAREPLP